ncbi:MAG TPA: D-alanyl-D-alanine carboxypeptidase family protein [Alphaproteobacteria bacterium]
MNLKFFRALARHTHSARPVLGTRLGANLLATGLILGALATGLTAGFAVAPADAAQKAVHKKVASVAPKSSAEMPTRYAAIIIDDATGRVLHQVNADEQRYPASLTKMMTIYVTLDAIEKKKLTLDSRLDISMHAANQAPSKLGIMPGDNLTVRQAIMALVTKSANDVAVALGETVGGTEPAFAAMMNKRAQALGMTNTLFKNANGLPDPQQHTTARDLATLARALHRDFPQHYHFFSTPEFTYKGVTIGNHNRVLTQLEGADGLKTGYIRASGFNLATSAQRGNRRIVGIVLGGESGNWRDARMVQLMDQAFDNTLTNPTPTLVAAATPKSSPASATRKPTPRPDLIAQAEMSGSRADTLADPALNLEQGDTESTVAALPSPRPRYSLPKNSGTEWAIQVGAFSRQAPAQAAANKAKGALPKTLSSARVAVLDGKDDGSKLYRARLVGLTEASARTACRQLEQKGVGCITVAPEMGSNDG